MKIVTTHLYVFRCTTCLNCGVLFQPLFGVSDYLLTYTPEGRTVSVENAASLTVSNVTPSVEYTFMVAAVTAAGVGVYTKSLLFTMPQSSTYTSKRDV